MDRPPRLLTALCRSQVGAANQLGTVPGFEPITCLSFVVVIVQEPHVPLSALSLVPPKFPPSPTPTVNPQPFPHFYIDPSHAHCHAKQTTQGVSLRPISTVSGVGAPFSSSKRPPGREGVQHSGTRPSRGPSIGSLHQRFPFSLFSHMSSSSPLEPPLAD
ncbi:hypothetical protein FA10DRAFT_189389 [Acaromyces ingoldii]|uniref:Uncharacterized protein n=1 Tax=Acaromyces ingoldii TaxID=215250 RepID=A0A316YD55_9BASI|nr:hypothetical protein FA10DRAFT_189389 [Acaromyces ingoldii]PWN87590.1 hypothetical protein FA10DRAFT_189389 [Acaromyces ingoldii]